MPLFRYFIQLSFLGTRYHGWQIQPNAVTVQSVLDKTLSVLLGEEIRVTGAGRTDTGVHARFFMAHFDTRAASLHQMEKVVYSLNGMLPGDIAVQKIIPVKPDAHARFHAVSRTYEYLLSREKDPFLSGLAHFYYGTLDLQAMRKAARCLAGEHNFKAFSRSHTQVKTYICRVTEAEWLENDHRLIFRITADRFLRNMVRAIVGTMIETGKGRILSDEWQTIMDSEDRSLAGPSAPAHGLYLTRIEYPPEIGL
ncbi:MAG: tRNA pseudouridine(38-40) synthase TruA [Bacteroidales bacterium]